ncbi:unnamed protein product [Bursaphelenchus okinawaensis]|uniref:Collagen type IV alpha-3-binding protein n=1 Tax=Bursaphelenchus okinawaensis TaxID=465554 RepID=A0A811JVG4_9BILA|nr:unnamed protein product [Bursaphelenchus okinawaensis]CAG9085092.1 unnamed protein product [Bursaphelenchus okinawaensis]
MAEEISLSGVAFKYTNFLFGYQKRFFKLHKGTIYYYLSKENERDGCRKFRVLQNFKLEFDDDPNRLDICFPDERWSLRFSSVDEQNLWRDALDAFLQPQSSSKILSTEKWNRHVKEEPEKPQSSLISRTEYLSEPTYTFNPQRPVDLDLHRLEHMKENLPQQFQLVHEVLSKIVETRAAPLDLALVEQSVDRCKQIAEAMRYLQSVLPTIQVSPAEDALEVLAPSEQLNESMLSDDEWHDATSDNIFEDASNEIYESLRNRNLTPQPTRLDMNIEDEAPIFAEIRRVVDEQLNHALASVDEDGQWELFVKDGEMRMYKMENEVDGVVSDPLKAIHFVDGVTAREFIEHFYDPDLKKEWDDTLVSCKLVDKLNEETVVLHQLHKRVWPAAQRESLFWSHYREVHEQRQDGHNDAFFVCNHDCEREDVPLTDSSCVRVGLTIAMLCQTEVKGDPENPSRANVRCKIVYVAQVHPGGWVPASALRQVYKREYPKFLRQFSSYVLKKVNNKPLKL